MVICAITSVLVPVLLWLMALQTFFWSILVKMCTHFCGVCTCRRGIAGTQYGSSSFPKQLYQFLLPTAGCECSLCSAFYTTLDVINLFISSHSGRSAVVSHCGLSHAKWFCIFRMTDIDCFFISVLVTWLQPSVCSGSLWDPQNPTGCSRTNVDMEPAGSNSQEGPP